MDLVPYLLRSFHVCMTVMKGAVLTRSRLAAMNDHDMHDSLTV